MVRAGLVFTFQASLFLFRTDEPASSIFERASKYAAVSSSRSRHPIWDHHRTFRSSPEAECGYLVLTKTGLYDYDAENGQPDPLAALTVSVWIRKGSIVSNVLYHSPFFGFGTLTYEERVFYVFISELRRACPFV